MIRECQNCQAAFEITGDDIHFYDRIKVPPPTWCPECRLIRRFLFRNERLLFRVKDAITGKEIFSGIPPQAPVKVYDRDYWWGDAWDAMEYGRDYDFSRPFFEQFRELMYEVPWPSRNIEFLVASDYSNQAGRLKNCYLCFNIGYAEDSAYVNNATYVKNSFDVTEVARLELSYECFGNGDGYHAFFSNYCDESNEIWFSRDCIGCSNCFGCVNLRNKSYHIFNKPYTKEGYFTELQKFNSGSFGAVAVMKKRVGEFWSRYTHKFMHGIHNINVSGELVSFSKNAKFCYSVEETEDSKYCSNLDLGVRDSYDYSTWGEKSELMYEVLTSGEGCRNVKFTWDCWPADQDVEYSVQCASSTNLFGCMGLKKKSYCIFNKQYAKNEYFALREKIIKHMNEMPYTDKRSRVYRYGEFFPPEFSPYTYNETIAQDFFTLSKAEAESKGFLWRDPEAREYQTTLDAKDLPDHIRDVGDSITNEIIKCLSCSKAYRIIPMEFEFLKKIGLPLPRLCSKCRYLERIKHRNPPKFWHRQCQCAGEKSEKGIYTNVNFPHLPHSNTEHCPVEFITSYAPEKTETIYCEDCYQAEVI